MTETRINIKTLSKLVGVAPSTVSRILSGKARQYRIAVETEAKVLEQAEKFGFRPNYFAHSLNTGKTFNIGLIMANKIDSYLGSVIEGVESRLRETEYQMVLATCENNPELERRELERMLYRQVDGIIIYPSAPTENNPEQCEFLRNIVARDIPVVIIDRDVDVDTDKVFYSDYQAGVDAAKEFISAGCRCFGLVDMPGGSKHDRRRLEGFIDTLRGSGVSPAAIIQTMLFSDNVDTAAADLMAVDCLWGVNTAQVMITAAAMSKMRDVSALRLRGLGVEPYIEQLPYKITLQPMPSYLMGETASSILLERITSEEKIPARTIVLPWPEV